MDSTHNTPTPTSAKLGKNGLLRPLTSARSLWDKTLGEYGYLLFATVIPMVLFYLIYLIGKQLYPFGGMSAPSSEEHVLARPVRGEEDALLLLVRGRPAAITGLDEGSFSSVHTWPRRVGEVLVLSEPAFKLFSLPLESQASQKKEKRYV